jgi:hypothetical protein
MPTAYETWESKQKNNNVKPKTAYELWEEKQINNDTDLQRRLAAARSKDNYNNIPTGSLSSEQIRKQQLAEQQRNITAVSAKPTSAIAPSKNKPLYPNATIGPAKAYKPVEVKKNVGAFIEQFGEGVGAGNVARAITNRFAAPIEQQLQKEMPSALPRYTQPDTRFEGANPIVKSTGKFAGQLTKELGYAAAGQGITGAALSKMPWLAEAIQKTPNVIQAITKGGMIGTAATGLKQIAEPKENKPGLKGLATNVALWGGGALGGELASKAIESLAPQLSKIPGLVDIVMKPNGAQTMQVKPVVEALARGASNNLIGTIAALQTVSDEEKKRFIENFGPNLLAQGIMDILGAKGNIKISDLEKAGLTKKQLPFLKKAEVPIAETKPLIQEVTQEAQNPVEAVKPVTMNMNKLPENVGVIESKKTTGEVPISTPEKGVSTNQNIITIPVIIGKNKIRGKSIGTMIDSDNDISMVAQQKLTNVLKEVAKETGIEPTPEWVTKSISNLLKSHQQAIDSGSSAFVGELPNGRKIVLANQNVLDKVDFSKELLPTTVQQKPSNLVSKAEVNQNGLQGQEGQGQTKANRPSGQELGIVFKPKLPFQQVEPRRKTMMVNATEEKSPTIDKIVTSKKGRMPMKTIFDNLYQKFVNNQHYITLAQKAAGKTVANKDMAIMASNSRNAPGISGYILKDALVTKEGKEIGKPFKSIIDEVSKQHEQEFNDYILHRHNIGRMAQKKPVFSKEVTPEMSEQQIAKYEAKFPDFKRIADQYDSFNKNFMQEWAVKTGLVSKETMDHLNNIYPHYAPTYRQMEPTVQTQIRPGKGFANQPNILKKATGSERPILNPLEKTIELVDKTVKAAKYNEVGQTIVDAIRKDPEKMREWGEIVKEPEADLVNDAGKALENGDIGEAVDNFVSQYDKPKLSGKNIVRVMENGKPVYLKINKPEFLESVTGLTNYKPGEAEKIARMVTTPYKALITGENPIFAAKNIARDIPAAYINGSVHNPFKFVQNLSEAAKDMATNSESFREYKALGGGQSGFFLDGNGEKSNLKKLYKGEGAVSQFNESIESLPRYAEYKATVERGGGDYASKMQGIFNANELTVNFARHGNITKSVDAFVPYLNPSVQGLDKLVRQFQKNPLATIGKGVLIVTIPQIALNLINNSNPNYQQLDNRTKDTYFLIPNYADKGKTFIKIPKSREYGVIFADTFDRVQRGLRGNQHAFDGYLGTVETNFAPTNVFENNIASPATLNLKSNKDFAGRTIVPQGIQSRSPKYQYDENTSEISKAIGQKLNISPKQADYLIKSYTGVIGTFALPMTTKSSKGTMQQIIGNTVSRNFTADPVFSNDIVNRFYEQKKKTETIKADAKFNNKELSMTEDNKRHQYNVAAEEISKIYDQIRTAKTNEEKRNLRKKINEIAKIATESSVDNEVKETKNDVLEKLGIEPESKQKFY